MSSLSGSIATFVALLKITPIQPEGAPVPAQELRLVAGQSLRIGRSTSNDLVLPDTKVSRFHALVSASATGVVLSDLASTNGTFFQGNRLTSPIDLADRDEFDIGGFHFAIEMTPSGDALDSDSARTVLSQMQPFEVCVLLVDVCGYTTMGQALPESDVTETLRTWLDHSASVITQYHGTVDKFIGDCVMSLWRSNTATPKSLALEAARAGAEIVRSTMQMSAFSAWKHAGKYPWQCRAVLHSGTALMGSVSGGGKGSYTVLGDTVNVAFRIEHLADRFTEKLIVSEQTAGLISDFYALTNLGSFVLEGRSGEIQIFGQHVS